MKKQHIFLSAGIILSILGAYLFQPFDTTASVTERTPATEIITSGQKIKAASGYTPLFGFGLTQDAGEKLTTITLQLVGAVSTASPSDIDGLAIFIDNGSSDDILDGTDTKVGEVLAGSINVNSPTTIAIAGGADIPAPTGDYDFIVAVKTSATISNGETVSFGVAGGTNTYTLSVGAVGATALTAANTLTADTQNPTPTNGGPQNGQISAPVQAMVDESFNENLATATVTTATVSLKANSPNTAIGAPSGSNLCATVSLSGGQRIVCDHSALTINTWYTFTITTGVTDVAGNALAANFISVWQTGSFGGGAEFNPPPFIRGTLPTAGGQLATNGKITINFSTSSMKTSGEGSILDINNIQLFLTSSGGPVGNNLFTNSTGWSWSAGTKNLRITPPTLTAGLSYRLIVKADNNPNPGDSSCGGASEPACVMSTDNMAMMPNRDFIIDFTAVVADNTAPSVVGSFPDNAATSVDRAIDDINISFSEGLDPATVSSSTVKIYCEDTDNNLSNGCNGVGSTINIGTDPLLSGISVVLDPDGRVIHISPNQILPASSKLLVQVGNAIADLVGNTTAGGANVSLRSFTTGVNINGVASDSTSPTVLFANADNFGIFITLSEAVKFGAIANTSESTSDGVNDVNNLSNWTIENSSDGSNWMQMPLSGKRTKYDSYNRTLVIDGLAMPPNQQFKATASTSIQDLSGNGMSSDSRIAQGTVKSSFETGGMMQPGATMGPVNFFNMGVSPIAVSPKSPMAGATTRYRVEFKTTTAVPLGGKITLTFPSGFSFDNNCATLPTDTFENSDINGQAPGTVAFTSIACNSVSRMVTLTLSGVGTNAGDMVRFEFQGVVNSTVPKDFSTSGYTVDIKTYNSSNTLIESMSSMPFFISVSGLRIVSGTVFKDNGAGAGIAANGIKDGSEPGIDNIRVCMGGPAIGFQCQDTSGGGAYSFPQLSDGFYHLELPPISSGAYTASSMSRDINISGSNVTENFGLQEASANFILTVAVTGAGLSGTKLDVFAFSSSGSMNMNSGGGPGAGSSVVRECTIGVNCDNVQLPLTQGRWQVGLGPWMPKDPGAPSSVPDFSFMPPRPEEVSVTASGVQSTCNSVSKKLCFTLSASSNQIKGKVVDASGSAIPNVFVMTRPAFLNESSGPATAGVSQTDSNGNFSAKVVNGTYLVEASMPGMPPSNGIECTVKDNNSSGDNNTTADVYCAGVLMVNDVSGFTSSSLTLAGVTNNDLVIRIAKGSTSVSGQVLDDSSNPIAFAHVQGMEVNDSGAPAGGWRDAPTDSSGNYTLYVSGGASGSPKKWKLSAFAPGFGELSSLTVSVTENDTLTGKNLQATSSDFGTITGSVTQNSVAVSGAFINIHGVNGGNGTVTGADGSYSLKARAGSGYTIEGFVPGQGPTTSLTGITVTASSTLSGKNLTIAQPGTIVVYVCQLTNTGAAPSAINGCASRKITTAFVDARGADGRGNGTGSNTTQGKYEIIVSAGTYTVRASNQSVGQVGSQSSVIVTGGDTVYVNILPPALYSVSGTITSLSSSCIEGTAVFLSASTNGRMMLAKVDANGAWSVSNVPAGNYSIGAGKPGCVDSAGSGSFAISNANITQADDADLARTLVLADRTITGQITLSGSNIAFDTMVMATSSTGIKAIGQVDTTQSSGNNYTLNITSDIWTIQARSDGYQSSTSSVNATSGSAIQNITLSAISGYTRKEPQPFTVKPSQGGMVKNPEISDDFELNIPAGVLGTSSNDGSVSTKETTAVANTSDQQVIGGKGIEITPKDASGQPITTVSSSSGSSATITVPYTESDIPAGYNEGQIVLASWSDEKGQWDPLSTTCDTVNNKCTATVSHFSTFATIVATGGGAPSTPSGLSATVAGSSQINLSWTAVSGATSYDVYRSDSLNGAYPRLGDEPTVGVVTSYSNTGLSAGTTYYYQVSALNDSGESAASSAVSATTQAYSGGGGTSFVNPPPTNPVEEKKEETVKEKVKEEAKIISLEKPIGQRTKAEIEAKIAEIIALINELKTKLAALQSQETNIVSGYKIKAGLEFGQTSEDVRQLQIFLKSQGTDIYPDGLVTGYFGPKTKNAVIYFQEKYQDEILKPFDLKKGNGYVGIKTAGVISRLLTNP
ncbi:MAG: carboxypeptidase regulatory-like domain-containing protein [bacterium]